MSAKRFFRRHLRGIRNIISWWKLIYSNGWWDQSFLFEIMRKQLLYMAENFEKNAHHVGAEKKAKKMRISAELCSRLSSGGALTFDNSGREYFGGQSDYGSMVWIGPIRIKNKPNVHAHKDYHLEQYYSEYLFKMLNKYNPVWWD